MKSLLVVLLIATVISCIVLTGTIQLGVAETSTVVNGVINSDVIWTKVNSPYTFTGPVTIGNGVTLTVEAGTVVSLNEYNLQVHGTLNAICSSISNITFTSNPMSTANILFTSQSPSWNEQTGTGSIIENVTLNNVLLSINGASPKLHGNYINEDRYNKVAITIDGGSPAILNNTIKGDIEILNNASPIISNNSINGGIHRLGLLTNSAIITHNTIVGGSGGYGAGIDCGGNNAYVSDNTIYNCYTGIVVDHLAVIQGNLVFNNTYGVRIGGTGDVSVIIRNNTVTNNTYGIYLANSPSSHTISYNNIYANFGYNFFLLNGTTGNFNAPNNWWGTNITQKIKQTILDFSNPDYKPSNNHNPIGTVSFEPFLTTPNPLANPILYQTQKPITTVTPIPTQLATPDQSTSLSPSQSIPSPNTESSVRPQTNSNEFDIVIPITLAIIAVLAVIAIMVAYRKRR